MKTGEELVLHFLKDMYYAEKAVLKLVPDLVAAAQSDGLKKIFVAQTDATKSQIKRLEGVFQALGRPIEAVTCEAIAGLIEETDEVISSGGPSAFRDAALVACLTAIKHYGVARYTALSNWLQLMGQKQAAELLRGALKEDSDADSGLNELFGREFAKVFGRV